MKKYRLIESVKMVAKIVLGFGTFLVTALIFSPFGRLICGVSSCFTESGVPYEGNPWVWLGVVGFLITVAALIVLGGFYMLGDFTTAGAKRVRRSADIWYVEKQIAKRKNLELASNGDPSDYPLLSEVDSIDAPDGVKAMDPFGTMWITKNGAWVEYIPHFTAKQYRSDKTSGTGYSWK